MQPNNPNTTLQEEVPAADFQVVDEPEKGKRRKISHISSRSEESGVPVMADLSMGKAPKSGARPFRICLLILALIAILAAAGVFLIQSFWSSVSQSEGEQVQLTIRQPEAVAEETDSGADAGLSTEAIAAAAEDSVVGVVAASLNAAGDGYVSNSQGSGVILTESGYILTNAHVIGTADEESETYIPASRIVVYFHDGNSVDAALIGFDTKTDLAVLKVEVSEALSPAQLGDPSALSLGERVVAIGNPGGVSLSGTVTQGIVSGLNRTVTVGNVGGGQIECIQTDAAINTGNSGGALLNKYGQVVGIIAVKMSDSYENIGFAIPIDVAKPIAEQLIAYGNVLLGRVQIGLSYTSVTDDMSAQYGIPTGLRVIVVNADSDCAGKLQVGDIITAVDGTAVQDKDSITSVLQTKMPGDPVVLTVYRSGADGEQTLNISVTLLAKD